MHQNHSTHRSLMFVTSFLAMFLCLQTEILHSLARKSGLLLWAPQMKILKSLQRAIGLRLGEALYAIYPYVLVVYFVRLNLDFAVKAVNI